MFGFRRNSVTISQSTNGLHGDHWCAVFGFGEPDQLSQSVAGIVEDLRVEAQPRPPLSRSKANYGLLSAWGIQQGNQLATLYPVVRETETIPVLIKEVVQWRDVNNIEAQVRGSGRDTFGLDFFATDYLENMATYHRGGEIPVRLAGLAYTVERADDLPDNFDPDFCCYLPNTELPCGHDFNFIGDVRSLSEATALGREFVLIRVKLINAPEQPDMFDLPILASRKNVHCEDLRVGDKVSGCFWLQGRLAN